jgi:hypothetical protein
VVVIFVIAVILTKACNNKTVLPAPPDVVVVHDTVYSHKDSIVYTKPKIIKGPSTTDTVYCIEDTEDTACQRLYDDYRSVRVYQDSLIIKDLGKVSITDTISHNQVSGRSYKYNISIPIVKETTTVYPKPRPEMYVGVMLNTQGVHSALLYKTQDRQYGASVGIGTNGKLIYGVQTYWKLK